jgi:hypothetical protein
MTVSVLRRAPWLLFFIIALPAPIFFLWRYFTATEEVGVWMLFVLVSLGLSSLVGLAVVLLLFLYRRRWEARLRGRLAADGITADELVWFEKELSADERRTLGEMSRHNPLLADAYRDTLAARLTASRVAESAARETVAVEQRLRQAASQAGANRSTLDAELRADRERLERITREAEEHKDELETRLRMIEAAASRGLNEAETARALLRLDTVRGDTPYALDAARGEQEAREQIERMLREKNSTNNP